MSCRKWIDIDKAIILYRDKRWPTTKVSKIVGCSVQTLITRLREKGISIRSCGNHMEKCPFDVLRYEYEDLTMSTANIAYKHNLNPSSVWERLVKGGVKMRDRRKEVAKVNTKISVSEHPKICLRYQTNKYESCADIAKDYNVHKTTIADILKRYGIDPEHSGARIKSYKGGITPLHTRIRHCEKSMFWRRACMVRDNYTCQISGEKGGKLEVHHLKPFSQIFEEFLSLNSDLDPEKDCNTLFNLSRHYAPFWDIDNGITLAAEIHIKLHIC